MPKPLLTLVCVFTCFSVFGQTYNYYFNGNFNEAGSGPALSEVLSCGASAGNFSNQTITTTLGDCGSTTQPVFNFNEGGGLSFPNNSTIGGTYTINIFWKFSALSGYQRIIDFLDGSTDVGLYTLNNCLNFYPNGNVGACPYFVADKYYLLTLVRDGSTGMITIYVNGTSFGTYNDASNTYVPSTSTTPIVFFRDNIASSAQCEDRSGSVKYISISPTTSSAAEVSNTWNNICTIITLPLYLTSFAASKEGSGVRLNWSSDQTDIASFELESSTDGRNFSLLSVVPAHNTNGHYSFLDAHPASAKVYYRLKMLDAGAAFRYSNVLTLDFRNKLGLRLYPNPTSGELVVSGIHQNKPLRLLNANGTVLKTWITSGEVFTISLEKYPKGIYILEYDDGQIQREKLVRY